MSQIEPPTDSSTDTDESVSKPERKDIETDEPEIEEGPTPVHIEICVNNESRLPNQQIEHLFKEYWKGFDRYFAGKRRDLPPSLSKDIEYIQICTKMESVPLDEAQCYLHIFRNNEEGISEQIDDETSSEDVHVANTYILPNKQFDGLFESLIFEDDIKDRLIHYMETVSYFGKVGIDKTLITWNGVILLHGPPGTGKTSLCKALAHKLSVRLIDEFSHSSLIEINAHSLFSKWFSESGKIVQKMFKSIIELIECKNSLIFVLIDEVESLAVARTSAMNGAEPSDAIRAVNAVLTQLDRLQYYPNVLVLATSNISQSIDLAFIDRADLKQYIGNPMPKARYHILKSCIQEMLDKGILCSAFAALDNDTNGYLLCYDKIKRIQTEQYAKSPIPFPKCVPIRLSGVDPKYREKYISSQKLLHIIESMEGFSGRSLRKLPFITSVHHRTNKSCSLMRFLKYLRQTVQIEKKEREKLRTS